MFSDLDSPDIVIGGSPAVCEVHHLDEAKKQEGHIII